MKAITDLDQRQILIPKIAKTLASLTLYKSDIDSTIARGPWSPEWIEQKLRLSLTQALQSRTQLRPIGNLASTQTFKRSREYTPSHLSDKDSSVNLCHVTSSAATVRQLSHNYTTAVDVAAGRYANPLGYMYGSSTKNAGGSTFEAGLVGDARHACAVTHPAAPNDQREETSPEIDMLEDMTGQKQLIHNLQSTFFYWHDQDVNLLESIDIYRDTQPFELASDQDSNIGKASSQPERSISDDNINFPSSSATFRARSDTMDSQSSMQSLSELLGDDSRLAKMWKRRQSICPPGEDEAEQLHNMFLYDPDMKLFSPSSRESSFADMMMFDSYDFSRTSSNSSISSRTSSASTSRGSFEQLERPSSYSHSSQSLSSTPDLTSSYNGKDQKRSFLGSNQSSRLSRTSDDDLLFQQTSFSRSVDTEERSTSQHYSGTQ